MLPSRLQPLLLALVKSLKQIGPVVAEQFQIEGVTALDLRVAHEFVGRPQRRDDRPVHRQFVARVDRL